MAASIGLALGGGGYDLVATIDLFMKEDMVECNYRSCYERGYGSTIIIGLVIKGDIVWPQL